MTKSTITRERLEELAAGQSGFNLRIATHEESQELARMALSTMDSEPVAWTWHYREQWHVTNDERRAEFVAKDGDVAVLPLYRHAQPVPVVSADLLHTAASAIEDLLEHTDPDTSYYSGVWADVPGKLRAAAPQSPGSEPATVPGTWIPVSERLPEAGGDMIVFTDGIVMSGVSYAKKKGFYIQALEYDDDEPVDSVTHWMPLPAGPQEVKGE